MAEAGVERLKEARDVINDVDARMAALFVERMGAVANVAAYKAQRGLPVLDAERERAVIARNAQLVSDDIRPYYVRFLERMMEISREYQHDMIEGRQ